MLRIVTGKPGSGKSYYAISRITSEHCIYDHIAAQYDLKPRIHLCLSLDGVRIDHVRFDDLVRQHGLAQVVNVDYWKPIAERYDRIVLVIDEAQRYFPSNARDLPNSVFYFFEYHRHLGIDLYLLTQHASSLHRRVLNICEQYIEAAPPSLRGLGKLFRYRTVDVTTGAVISRSVLKADPRVFRAYQSAAHAQGLKPPKSALAKYIGVAAALFAFVPLGIYAMRHAFFDLGNVPRETSAKAPSPPSSRSSPVRPAQASRLAAAQSSRPAPITRDEIMRWSLTGVPISDLPRLPVGCRLQGHYVHCPPFTLPSDVQLSIASYVCNAKRTACHTYIPVAAPDVTAPPEAVQVRGEGAPL